MQLPFCKICGEHHRLGHCPLWDEPPLRDEPPAPIERKPDATKIQTPVARDEEESTAAVAQDPWREIWRQARALAPEDLKQEEMPVYKPRYDRNAYQRELMRKRRSQGR